MGIVIELNSKTGSPEDKEINWEKPTLVTRKQEELAFFKHEADAQLFCIAKDNESSIRKIFQQQEHQP